MSPSSFTIQRARFVVSPPLDQFPVAPGPSPWDTRYALIFETCDEAFTDLHHLWSWSVSHWKRSSLFVAGTVSRANWITDAIKDLPMPRCTQCHRSAWKNEPWVSPWVWKQPHNPWCGVPRHLNPNGIKPNSSISGILSWALVGACQTKMAYTFWSSALVAPFHCSVPGALQSSIFWR